MEHFKTNWKSCDGLDIAAYGWVPENRPAKAVVCLVHGIGEHTGRYLHIAEAFTREGLVFFGADLRGHGNSRGKKGHFPSIEVVNKDIDLLLEHARERYPGIPLFLYGHSLGGILVLYYCLKQKPDIQGVISTSPGLHNALEKQPVKLFSARVLGLLVPEGSIPSGLNINELSHDQDSIKAYSNDPMVHDRVTFGFGKAMLKVTQWTLKHAGEFPLPLLLMHGKADSMSYPSSSIEFAAALNGNCKLVLWDEGYHELHNEPFKEEVLKTMTSWIADHLD